MKVLFLTPHPFSDPSSRLRVIQYEKDFEARGIQTLIKSFTDEDLFRIVVGKKTLSFISILKLIWCYIKRLVLVIISEKFDIIFIHRELSPFMNFILDFILNHKKKKIIYDIDDAVYLKPDYVNRKSSKLRSVSSASFWSKNADAVIIGNSYLEKFVRSYSDRIHIVPTAVDFEKYYQVYEKKRKRSSFTITLGWIGTPDAIYHLQMLDKVLCRLHRRYNLKMMTIGIVGNPFKEIDTTCFDWSFDREVEYLSMIDIGLYPLQDVEYSWGKSGYKTILYMASGIPCVASNIGVNTDIVKDSDNGFLANDEEEWEKKLSMLIESRDLRNKFVQNGFKTVKEKFSKAVVFEKLCNIIEEVHEHGRAK
jgi:L-malate glycosyltransferase